VSGPKACRKENANEKSKKRCAGPWSIRIVRNVPATYAVDLATLEDVHDFLVLRESDQRLAWPPFRDRGSLSRRSRTIPCRFVFASGGGG